VRRTMEHGLAAWSTTTTMGGRSVRGNYSEVVAGHATLKWATNSSASAAPMASHEFRGAFPHLYHKKAAGRSASHCRGGSSGVQPAPECRSQDPWRGASWTPTATAGSTWWWPTTPWQILSSITNARPVQEVGALSGIAFDPTAPPGAMGSTRRGTGDGALGIAIGNSPTR